MKTEGALRPAGTRSTPWLRYIVIALVVEKIVQHVFVTAAFFFNWDDIASTVAVAPGALMVLGGAVAVLFGLSLWGLLARKSWATYLAIGLALFDIVGEFVAQGKVGIVITWSFLVAITLLIVTAAYRAGEARE